MKESLFDRLAGRILSCPAAERLYAETVKKELRLLCPAQEIKEACRVYYREKLSLLLKIFCAGVALIGLVFVAERSNVLLGEDGRVQRGEIGERAQPVELEVTGGDDRTVQIRYDVRARLYTPQEIAEFANRFAKECKSLILGENESTEEVHTDLLLRDSYEGYPMDFSWESSDYGRIGEDGTVRNKELTTKELIRLTVCMTYEEEMYEHTCTVRVVPPKLTEAQRWEEKLLAAIRSADEEQKYTSQLKLPATIDGRELAYTAKEDSSVVFLLFLLPVVLVILFYAKDRDLNKAVEERKKRMSLKYPEFVSKFLLLLGTGMTVRNVFVRLSEDRALGEDLCGELKLVVRDTKNGMSIKDALDRFGKRAANPLYMKFIALLIQNIKKGTDDLTAQFSDELTEAFSLRKAHARQLGEEAGTKLLAPMILMLVVVMAVLMVPAFLSFQL